MTKVLVLKSSMMGEQSQTNQLIEQLLKQRAEHGFQDDVITHDLTMLNLPVLNADIFSDIDYVYFEKFKAPTIFAVKNDKNGDFSIKNEKVIVHGERNFTWTGFSIINSSFFQGMETKYSDYWEDLMIHLAAEEKVVADIPNINWYDVGIKDTLDFLNSE